jgi:hypothetical protein
MGLNQIHDPSGACVMNHGNICQCGICLFQKAQLFSKFSETLHLCPGQNYFHKIANHRNISILKINILQYLIITTIILKVYLFFESY